MDPALETQNVWIHQNDPPENEPITCPSGYFMATFEDDDVRFFFHVGYGFAPWKSSKNAFVTSHQKPVSQLFHAARVVSSG